MNYLFHRKSIMLLRVMLLGTSFSLASCASKAPPETRKGEQGGATTLPINQYNDSNANVAGAHCFSQTNGTYLSSETTPFFNLSPFKVATDTVFQLFQQGTYNMDGRQLFLYRDRSRQKISFCDVLREQNAKVAIFQFAGVTCLECQDDAGTIESYLTSRNLRGPIAHILVLTDFFSDYSDQDFVTFQQYAPRAKIFYDESVLWKQFSANPNSPDRATIAAMNLNMQTVIYNQSGQKMNILSAAEQLLNQVR